jgi:flagellar protein FliS
MVRYKEENLSPKPWTPMHTDPRNSYLESQVLTATPQKLRLMLIEAALRAARQALNSWEEKLDSEANIALIRCREIISELLAAIRPDDSELTRNVSGIYVFLFKTLAEAQLHRDRAKVGEAIKVLEIEQETWRDVCEQMPNAPVPKTMVDSASGDHILRGCHRTRRYRARRY